MSMGRPYFHGWEEMYVVDGVLLAHSPPRTNRHGVTSPEWVRAMTLDRRYLLGSLHFCGGPGWVFRTSKGDPTEPTIDALIAKVHEVFGHRPRYALGCRS